MSSYFRCNVGLVASNFINRKKRVRRSLIALSGATHLTGKNFQAVVLYVQMRFSS